MNALELSLVIPCHNEERNLQPLVSAIHRALEPLGLGYEVVITDDCSTDGAWRVLEELAASDPRLRIQRFQFKLWRICCELGWRTGADFDESAVLRYQSLRCMEPVIQIVSGPVGNSPDEIETTSVPNRRIIYYLFKSRRCYLRGKDRGSRTQPRDLLSRGNSVCLVNGPPKR